MGSEMSVRAWKMPGPSGMSQSLSDSSPLNPDDRKSATIPPLPRSVITP